MVLWKCSMKVLSDILSNRCYVFVWCHSSWNTTRLLMVTSFQHISLSCNSLCNSTGGEIIMIFSLLSFSDYRVQCFPTPGFDSSGEPSGAQVAALNPLWIMSLRGKTGRTELHYPAISDIFHWDSEPAKTNIEDTVAPSR